MWRAALIGVALLFEPAVASAQNLNGEWHGVYRCSQGQTALRLTIEDQSEDERSEITARFDFGPTAENPDVPLGAFQMTGTRGPGAAGQLGSTVLLRGFQWIERPPGYIMVNLFGWYEQTPDGEIIHGQVYA